MANTPEGKVKKSILQWLSYQKNCEVFPIATTGVWDAKRNLYRTTVGRKGTPDILVCWHGNFIAIEVKGPRGKLTESQALVLQSIRENGKGIAVVANCVEDVVKAFAQALQ